MKIEAKVYKREMGNLKGFSTISLDDCFTVTGIKIIEGVNGLFISMPSQKDSKGEYRDICYPYTKEFRQQITDAILSKYYETENDESYVREEREAIQNEEIYGGDINDLPF